MYKFAFVGSGTIHGNATLQRLWFTRYLVNNGHQVHILLANDPANRSWVTHQLPGAQGHYLSARSLSELVIDRRRLISRIEPDIVHILGIGVQNLLMPLFSKPARPAYIPDFDELKSAQHLPFIRRFLNRILEDQALRASQAVVGASRFLVEHLSRRSACGHQKLLYLPYAYDHKSFVACQNQARQIRTSYRPRRLIVYMGNLYKAYQGDQVLLLAERMQSRREELVFLILGGGPELEASKQWVLQRGLNNYVYFLGYVTPEIVPGYLIAADILLFPIKDNLQNRARCPNKTFQYIGANRPIVTNRVGEVERALGSHGYYYDFDSIESFEISVLSALHGSDSYDAGDLLLSHTWERRSADYQAWLSSVVFPKGIGGWD